MINCKGGTLRNIIYLSNTGLFGRKELLAIMRLFQETNEIVPLRNNAVVIQGRMRAEVVGLNVVHVDSLLDSGHLVNLAAIVQDARSVRDAACVGFEINNVNFVETDQSHKETNICFRKGITSNEALLLENLVHLVKGSSQFFDGLVVCALGHGESTAVNTIVQTRVDPFIDGFNFFAHAFRIDVDFGVLGKFVHFRVEHANDFTAFIGYDLFGLFVKQNWNSVLSDSIVDGFIDIANAFRSHKWIRFVFGEVVREGSSSAFVIGPSFVFFFLFGNAKVPSCMIVTFGLGLLPDWMHNSDSNSILQSF